MRNPFGSNGGDYTHNRIAPKFGTSVFLRPSTLPGINLSDERRAKAAEWARAVSERDTEALKRLDRETNGTSRGGN
ncbi:MAG: hypothetical protein LBL52_02990 [Rickettsiales bacterium]|jgi:hypothetical protein|nr:hypothetical protein [Rickettsiales bacterium]